MAFKDKYTSITKNEVGKTKVTDDNYAICELLQELIFKLEDLRIK